MTAARATLALAVALVLTAVIFDTTPLYVPGIGLLIAYAGSRAWVRLAVRGARVEQRSPPRAMVEGEEHPLEVQVHTDLPIPAGTVTHPLAASPVPAGQRPSTSARVPVRPLRRGWQLIEPVTLHVRDPLRLAAAEVQASEAQRVLVLPRIEPVLAAADAPDGADGRTRMGAGMPRGDGAGQRTVPSEMDGLRAYRPGSPASRIHWPILARTGELVERRLVGGVDASPVIVLDTEDPEHPDDPEALDRAVRAAASLCRHLAPAAGCLLVLPGERVPYRVDPALRLWPWAHARLAVVEAGGRPPDYRAVSRDAAVFWVSASRRIPAHAGLAGGVGYVVSPYPMDVGEPAFTVAGCYGNRIGVSSSAAAAGQAA
jgi:uncharacterized protein (DUF58 family)